MKTLEADVKRAFDWTKWAKSGPAVELEISIIREMLKVSLIPGVISFGGGLPASELFPTEELAAACLAVLKKHPADSLQYSLSMGVPLMREFLAARVSAHDHPTHMDNIFVTGGSQQGLDLIGRLFLEKGSYVIMESPTYVGALQAFNFYGAKYCPLPMDEEGLVVDRLEEAVRKYSPRLIYVVPNFQNPSGRTLSYRRRVALIEIAARYNVPVVEDNPYVELRYSGQTLPSLASMAPDGVIQLGTFSKLISPGLRIGWICAPPEINKFFEKVKQAVDLHTNTFCQYVIAEFAQDGALDRHIEKVKKEYARRRDGMLGALEENFPSHVSWTRPEGGLFIWATLPEGVSALKLLPEAVKEKVSYIPGGPFFAEGGGENTMRMNFSNASPDNIREGMRRLGRVLHQHAKI
ncbi:MAG TPA: PLP-dependent aminotransferase family protein [candidate division Zixibacteria bacterium]|nr:PLP-dependent aminotransferase family protein [candidate division Zixibacteria bacterium]